MYRLWSDKNCKKHGNCQSQVKVSITQHWSEIKWEIKKTWRWIFFIRQNSESESDTSFQGFPVTLWNIKSLINRGIVYFSSARISNDHENTYTYSHLGFHKCFIIFLCLIVTQKACLILCVYLSINSRHLTALIGSEAGRKMAGSWLLTNEGAVLWSRDCSQPIRDKYCDGIDQSGPSWHWLTLSRPRII